MYAVRTSAWPSRFIRTACLLLAGVLAGPGCSDCDLSISTGALPDATVGVAYAKQLNSDCGGDVWFLEDGTLPPGIGLEDDGDLRGTPTVAGTYFFTVGVFDFGSDEQAYKGFALTVLPE